MANDRISVVVALDYNSAESLDKTGTITNYDKFKEIPDTFKKQIAEFMEQNVGYQTGPIFCLARLNGDPVTLQGKDALDGDIKISDVLPTSAGDVLIEFAIKLDSLVSIGVNTLLRLKNMAREFGEDNEVLLEDLFSSLSVGIESDEENVFCFLPALSKRDCVRYILIDEDWKVSYKSLFKDIEEVKITSLSIF